MDILAIASSTQHQTFTPVRRRESTINTRQFNAEPEKEWTTARCHRLLRALTSRVAILKKEISRFAQPGNDVLNPPAAKRHSSTQLDDVEWAHAKKRIRRTYSIRGVKGSNGLRGAKVVKVSKKSKVRKSYLPGEVLVPTPILARARGEHLNEVPQMDAMATEELAPIKTKRGRLRPAIGILEGEFQLTKPMREIRQDVTAIRYTTYEGIFTGLEALLRGTAQAKPEPKRRGARSLASIATRAIPRYVQEQEALLEAHMEATGSKSAIQSRDIVTEIYDELEDFGTSGTGWSQLRVVVRSHGIEVLCDAIRVGLFDTDFCGALVSLCIHKSAIDEGQLLVSALISSTHYPRPRTLYDQMSCPVTMLCKFAHHTGLLPFQYRQLAYIISSGIMPIEWLATKDFGSIWTEAIQLARSELENEEALAFLKNAVNALARPDKEVSMASPGIVEAVGNTLSSLLTTFVSIIILSKETEGQEELGASAQQYHQIVTMLQDCLFECQHRKVKSSKKILPFLASLFTDHKQSGLWEPGSDIIETLLTCLVEDQDDFTSISSTYSVAVMFLCQVARCCGRGASTSGFEYLEHLHLVLENLLSLHTGSKVLMGLIVDSAFTFAQKVPDRKHLDYAANMDAKYCTRGFNSEASLHNIPVSNEDEENSGFRWEEGIGEWVTATPAAANVKSIFTMDRASPETECDTPYRPPQHLRRQLEQEPAIAILDSSSTISDQAQDQDMDDHPEEASSPRLLHHASVVEISSDDELSARDSSMTESIDELGDTSLPNVESMEESEDELVDASLQDIDPSVMAEIGDGPADTSMQDIDTSISEDSDDEIEHSFTEESLFSMDSPSLLKSALVSNHTTVYRAPRLNRKIFGKSDDWQVFDESFDSTTSSLSSNISNESSGPSREFVDRAPRLGRKAIHSTEAFQLFDESDDELSFLSVSSQGEPLKDVTNTQRPRRSRSSLIQAKSRKSKRLSGMNSDSEDELCI